MATRRIIPRLVGGPREGVPVVVLADLPVIAAISVRHPSGVPVDRIVRLVASGAVEWDGDVPVEVWVPEDRLDAWRALEQQRAG